METVTVVSGGEKNQIFLYSEPVSPPVLADAGRPGEENWLLLSWASCRILKGPLTTWILFSIPASCSDVMECPAWSWCLQHGQTTSQGVKKIKTTLICGVLARRRITLEQSGGFLLLTSCWDPHHR